MKSSQHPPRFHREDDRDCLPTENLSGHPRVHNHLSIHRVDIIGDVHGCYDELVTLLRRLGHGALLEGELEASPHPPRVIFVGDIVDRGDRIVDSLKLLWRLHSGGYALSVVGNHDDRFLRWLKGGRVKLRHGLEESVAQFEALPEHQQRQWRERLIDLYSDMPWAIRLDDGKAIVAHAAWHADLEDHSTERIRSYTMYGPVTGETTPEGYPERIDWAPDYGGPELVVFGHQVYRAPYMHEYAIGIDTGCVFGGALTALRYPELEIVSVPSLRARYHRAGWKKGGMRK